MVSAFDQRSWRSALTALFASLTAECCWLLTQTAAIGSIHDPDKHGPEEGWEGTQPWWLSIREGLRLGREDTRECTYHAIGSGHPNMLVLPIVRQRFLRRSKSLQACSTGLHGLVEDLLARLESSRDCRVLKSPMSFTYNGAK